MMERKERKPVLLGDDDAIALRRSGGGQDGYMGGYSSRMASLR